MQTIETFTDATPLLGEPDALVARFRDDGHLFFRGLVPSEDVLEVRREFLETLAALDWLAPGTDPTEARPGSEARHEMSPGFWDGYIALQHLESFHRLAHHQAIIDAVRPIVGDPVLPHPQKIARMSFPDPEFFTAPHQDYRYIQGGADFVTAWLPLGSYPPDHGGLRVLSGSQRRGLLPVHAAKGAGGLTVDTDDDDPTWRTASFEPGDVVVFGCLTVHGAIPNRSDRLRLSVDYRYQSTTEPIASPSLGPHFVLHPDMPDWSGLSDGWTSTRWVDVPEDLTVTGFHAPTGDLVVPPSRHL